MGAVRPPSAKRRLRRKMTRAQFGQ